MIGGVNLLDVPSANGNFIVSVVVSAIATDEPTAKLLWELINDNQPANWQNISTASGTSWGNVEDAQPTDWTLVDTA